MMAVTKVLLIYVERISVALEQSQDLGLLIHHLEKSVGAGP